MAVDDDAGRLRLRIFAFVALSLFGALVARLWYLQGIETEVLQAEALTNVLEPVFEEAPRGRILDRNGRVLVDNEVVQVVTVDRNVVASMGDEERFDLYHRLAVAISRSGRLTKVTSIEQEVADPAYGPFDDVAVAVGVDPGLLVFLGERPELFPGVRVVQRTVRSYPYGNLAAHLLGYVGPITRSEWEAANAVIDFSEPDAKTYQLNDEIGKTGVERIFEDELRGVPGVRFLEVDNRGEVIRERVELGREPRPGNDVWLTIDVDLQARAEAELAGGLDRARDRVADAGEPRFAAEAGSVVAIDPRDGGVLAMASFPTYDPSEFINGISTAQFELLTSPDNYSPILNRAIQGNYAPGSTFKVVTALAAVTQGVLGPDSELGDVDTRLPDAGVYVYPFCEDEFEAADTCLFESPRKGLPEASFDLAEAITVSSDVYFYRLGGEGFWRRPAGPDGDEGIQATARSLGLGAGSGVQLPYERAGVVPDRDYFDLQAERGVFLRDGSQWFAGDTINLAIGQGDVLITPVQLANVYATVANGGRLHQPNIAVKVVTAGGDLVREFGPRVLRDLELPPGTLDPIVDGLLGVPRRGGVTGTAWLAFEGSGFPLARWPVAGKTGTAEVDGRADTSLFAAWGPNDHRVLGIDVPGDPEIALAVVLEEAGFGSTAAAPVAAAILEPLATDSLPRALTQDELAARDREAAAEPEDGA